MEQNPQFATLCKPLRCLLCSAKLYKSVFCLVFTGRGGAGRETLVSVPVSLSSQQLCRVCHHVVSPRPASNLWLKTKHLYCPPASHPHFSGPKLFERKQFPASWAPQTQNQVSPPRCLPLYRAPAGDCGCCGN